MSVGPVLKRRLVDLSVSLTEGGLRRLGVPPPQALLLLGHMRSGSTLLLHLLVNHPQIAGLGERNAIYLGPHDFGRLALRARLARPQPLARLRYVTDQLNHNHLTPHPELFAHPRLRLLFLVRRPEPSLASLLDLTRTHYEPWSVERTVDYYVERLGALARYAGTSPSAAASILERAAFLTYEELTDRPGQTLASLQSFLDMDTEPAFSETYRVHDFTGTRGDPSENIRSGRIGRPRRVEQPAQLPAREIERARRAYDRCLEALAPFALATRAAVGPAGQR